MDRYHCRVHRIARMLGIGAVLTALCGCGLQQDLGSRQDVAGSGAMASPISGITTEGGHLGAAAMQGQVAVIDFWGSWCGPCRSEQPELNRLYETYHRRGVVFLGVDMRDDDASANAYRHDYGVAYASIADSGGGIAAAYDISAPPTLIVVDRHGRIAGRFLGTLVGASPALDRVLA
jgi:thiol-disulfide isomerase/thioredoxin